MSDRSGYLRAYRDANRERIRKRHSDWYAKNRESVKAKRREHYRRNKKAHAERGKRWRINNPERTRQLKLAYYYRHREKVLAKRRAKEKELRIKFPEKARKLDRIEYYRYREQRLKRKAANWRRLRAEVMALLGGCCHYCGESRLCCLQLDHVGSTGAAERKSRPGATVRLYRQIRKDPTSRPDIVAACGKCQWLRVAHGDDLSKWDDSPTVNQVLEEIRKNAS